MDLESSKYIEIKYDDQKIFFEQNFPFRQYFSHKRNTKKFPFHKNVVFFLRENPEIKIFFTLDAKAIPFKKVAQSFFINIDSYLKFCQEIKSNTQGRMRAFLGRNLSLKDVNITDAEKDDFIKTNASAKNIIDALENLDPETKKSVVDSLSALVPGENSIRDSITITNNEFVQAFSRFLTDKTVQSAFYSHLPRIQIEILKSHILFLENNLDKNEIFIQDWLDEDRGKYRRQRCLIFGVEYVDPKREGEFMRKRFDVLAEQNLDNHVLIELKSPSTDIFSVRINTTINEGITTEYQLSSELARAIPQILQYKRWYEDARPEEIQALGIEKKKINKCIIIMGIRKDDLVWKDNFQALKTHLGIEIYTYTDLIDKLKNTVRNLEQNLREQSLTILQEADDIVADEISNSQASIVQDK